MAIELIQNMQGDALDRLAANDGDIGVLRPWLGNDGRSYVTRMIKNQKTGVIEPKVFISNAPATLTRDAWIQFDNAVIRGLRQRLRVVADIRGAGLEFNLPNGMAHTVLQYQTLGDITRATLSMDPVRRGEADTPVTDVAGLPLPVIHKDFDFTARQILVSRQGGIPVDTTTAELAAEKVGEELERFTLGTAGTFSYGGMTAYGMTNLPQRITKTDMPVPDGTNGATVISALLTLRQALINARHFGPYRLYFNSQWAVVLDSDFSATKGDQTLRQRILAIEGFQSAEIVDHLPTTNWHVLMVEMATNTVRMVVGLEVQTVQWESQGGMAKHFKVMTLQVPQIRPDTAGTAGIGHGTTVAA